VRVLVPLLVAGPQQGHCGLDQSHRQVGGFPVPLEEVSGGLETGSGTGEEAVEGRDGGRLNCNRCFVSVFPEESDFGTGVEEVCSGRHCVGDEEESGNGSFSHYLGSGFGREPGCGHPGDVVKLMVVTSWSLKMLKHLTEASLPFGPVSGGLVHPLSSAWKSLRAPRSKFELLMPELLREQVEETAC
jgi:hypothetical protein